MKGEGMIMFLSTSMGGAGAMTPQRDEPSLQRRERYLAYFLVIWDVLEGIIAVTAGLLAGSPALVGFGIDSGIEVFAASVTAWQLRSGGQARYITALHLIALSFFALAIYVTFKSINDLVSQQKVETSILGIVLNVVAVAVMVPVVVAQRSAGKALSNQVLIAQSQETWLSNYLSISLLVGLGAYALFGRWWADPIVALLIAGVAVYSGVESRPEAGERHGSPNDHCRARRRRCEGGDIFL
jgi:divalent metal cation (Fe/Co/Zn/Cd) transporter